MSKRGYSKSNGATDVEGSRSKRRKEGTASSPEVDITMSDPIAEGSGDGEHISQSALTVVDPEVVKSQAAKLWQIVKDAVNKEGRLLAPVFLRKPSKRLYPDYYEIIKQPIALDDIKLKIDEDSYITLEAVRQDFNLCFSNAKTYNMKDSDIWRDAKELSKIVHKTYSKMVPDEDAEKKVKGPNLNRLIKARLQKLVDKADDSGRILSTEFMELPSRKEWPNYYKEIKKPQCLENIFKRIKRKEYSASEDFASDVELVFSNALAFNQDHTPIWEDALALRNLFRQLMSDMPPPFSLAQYAKPSNKIKIKPQVAHSAQPIASSSHAVDTKQEPLNPSSLLLRVPVAPAASKATLQQSTLTTNVIPLPLPTVPPVPAASAPLQSTNSTTPQPATHAKQFINSMSPHYPTPNPVAAVPAATTTAAPTPSTSTPVLRASSVINTAEASESQSPAPVSLHPSHQLKSILLRIQPRHRSLYLDHQDGVKAWAVRLSPGESRIIVGDVTYFGGGDDEELSSGAEDGEGETKQEEQEVDIDGDALKNGRKKGKGRRRGRPSKSPAKVTSTKPAAVKKKVSKVGEIQLKVNGLVMREQADQPGEWDIHLPLGSALLEIGEVGGLVWKVYIERPGGV